MIELSDDQVNDLLIDSILGKLTNSGRQTLTTWAQANPVRQQFIQEVHDPKIASEKMAIYLRVDPEKGYARFLSRLRLKRKRQKRQEYFLIGAIAVLSIVLFLWFKLRSIKGA